MTTRDRSHRETALLNASNLCLGRQRHHHVHVHGRRGHDNNHSYTYKVKSMAYGPRVNNRLMAYGPEVTLDLAYSLTRIKPIKSAVKAEA